MARNGSKSQDKRKGSDPKARVRRGKPKVCSFCTEHAEWVDYKDIAMLRRFVNDRGRIKARSATGNCSQHQRDVAVAVKTARELILLPYVVRTVSADRGDRRGGARRGRPDAEAATEGAEVAEDAYSEEEAADEVATDDSDGGAED